MVNAAERALEVLRGYKHGMRTNLGKKILTNHDAGMYLMSELGTMRTREFLGLLRAWRGQKLEFSYLTNASYYGGYGFIGNDVYTAYNRMMKAYSGKAAKRRSDEETFKRRTYWFRPCYGVISPTIECFRRAKELGLPPAR